MWVAERTGGVGERKMTEGAKMTEEGKSILFGIHVSGSVGWDVSIAKRPVNVQLDG